METEARGLKSGETYDFNVKIREKESGLIKAEKTVQIMAEKAETGFKCELKVEDVRLWFDKPGDLAGVLTSLEPNDVLFIDEIHRLSPVLRASHI